LRFKFFRLEIIAASVCFILFERIFSE
jgi:hypothetical protein